MSQNRDSHRTPSVSSVLSVVSPVPIAEMQQNATLCNKNRTFFLQLRDLRALCGEPPHTGSSVSIGTPAELPHSVHEPSYTRTLSNPRMYLRMNQLYDARTPSLQ